MADARGPNVNERVVKGERKVTTGVGGFAFNDIADRQGLADFVKANKDVLKVQDNELERKSQKNLKNEEEPLLPAPTAFSRPQEYKENFHKEEQNEETVNGNSSQTVFDLSKEEFEVRISQLPLDKQQLARREYLLKQAEKTARKIASPKGMNIREVISNVDEDEEDGNTETNFTEPPAISNNQMRKIVEKEMAEKVRQGKPVEEKMLSMPRFTIGDIESSDKDYERLELLSGFVFYPQTELIIRRFNLSDAVRLHNAKVKQDESALVDAVGNTLKGLSIRDLTLPDLRHVFYWHRFNSYTKTPWKIEWTSKYNNKNFYTINQTDIKYNTPKITREEYFTKWHANGFAIPTYRDREVFLREKLNDEEIFIFDKAQYFRSEEPEGQWTIQGKIDMLTKLCSNNLGAIEQINQFCLEIDHSINETLDLTDAKFDPLIWLEILKGQHSLIEQEQIRLLGEEDNDAALVLQIQLEDLQDQITEIEDKLKTGEKVEPDAESLPLNPPLLNFFPGI